MFKKYLSIFVALFLFSACAGTMKNREMCGKLAENVKSKKYDEALKNVKHEDFYPQENSKLLKNLETGTVYYLRGDYYQALKYFESAKKISDDLYTISIKKKIASGWDANLDEYYGERYERSLIRFYISLINYNIYQQGFYEEYTDDEGNVIPRKDLSDTERNFHLGYARSSIIEWDSLLQTMQNESLGEAIYKNDMMAKIWGAFIHSEFENSNDRQISLQLYRDADELLLRGYNMYPIFNNKSDVFNKDFKKLPNITFQQLHKDYIDETKYAKELKEFINRNLKNLERYKKDNVVILVKDDLISPKSVKTIEIPFPLTSFGPQGSDLYEFARLVMSTKENMPYVVIEFPEIKSRNIVNNYKATVFDNNGDEVAETDLTLLEPLSDIAKKTLDDKSALIKTAIISRITAKYVAAIASAYAVYSQGGTFAQLSAMAMFVASAKAINESSRADIRYWTTLASDIQMGGLRLDDGDYRVEISMNGQKIFEKNIQVKKGKTSFIDINN